MLEPGAEAAAWQCISLRGHPCSEQGAAAVRRKDQMQSPESGGAGAVPDGPQISSCAGLNRVQMNCQEVQSGSKTDVGMGNALLS